MPKCIVKGGGGYGGDGKNELDGCLTLGYSIIGYNNQPWINFTIKYVAQMYNLDLKKDVKLIS